MSEHDELLLARVIDACGDIDGRVKMQKIVYLLSEMGFVTPFQDFTIRQFGPFSRSVAYTTDVLRDSGVIVEDIQALNEDAGPESGSQYFYRVSNELKDLIHNNFQLSCKRMNRSLEEACSILRNEDRGVLEVAATRLFLERRSIHRPDSVEEELGHMKGHLRSYFDRANALVEELRQDGWLN